jgi:leader peptidase (prepilin peptidase)/N-methyltransferase
MPILSYLLLRGRCRYCGGRISPRYLVVEVLAGLLPVLFFTRFGATMPFFVYWPLSWVLLVLSFIDLDLRIIPDKVTLPGIVLGLIVAPLLGLLGFWESLIGVLVGGGALYLIGILGELFLKKESMGGGDVKLAAMLGAFMGWRLVLVALFVAFFVGAVAGIIVLARKPKDWDSSLPFGPFIALGAVLSLLLGSMALQWYASLL